MAVAGRFRRHPRGAAVAPDGPTRPHGADRSGVIRPLKLRARQVADKDFVKFDMILAMDQSNMIELRQMCPGEHTHKLRLLMEFAPGSHGGDS
jgi:protein-tyrosine-phosphatase